MPEVSFVIPAKNEEDALPALFDSIEAQTADVSFEVVVANDGSTDDTAAVVKEFQERADFDVSHVDCDVGDHGAARNVGATVASGRWYAFIDADTQLEEEYLEEMLAFVTDNDLDAAGSHCRYYGKRRWVEHFSTLFVNHLCMSSVRLILPGFNVFVNAESFEAVGGFPEVPLADYAFNEEIKEYGDVGIRKRKLVSTSQRRAEEMGVGGALLYYFRRWLQQRRHA